MNKIWNADAVFQKGSGKDIITRTVRDITVVGEDEIEGIAFINAKNGSIIKELDALIKKKFRCVKIILKTMLGHTAY